MAQVFLIPSLLAEGTAETIPAYVMEQLKKCEVIFAENQRTARRFIKYLDKSFNIDKHEWHTISPNEPETASIFEQQLRRGLNIAIISEAGCPGVADPGQVLVEVAQRQGFAVHPLVGPNSILLALMASGLNGQHFEFEGYLPVSEHDCVKKILEMENDSAKNHSTKIFIETPYRNKQLFDRILRICNGHTLLCVAANLTAKNEFIRTHSIKEWRNKKPELHKIPAIFLLQVK